jgi:hypothetical protein
MSLPPQIQVYRTDYITDTTNFQLSNTSSAKARKKQSLGNWVVSDDADQTAVSFIGD